MAQKFVFIALARPKTRTKCPGSYEVLDTTDLVSKITDGQGYTDWVHNSHLSIIPTKNEDFEIPLDHEPEIRVWSLPRLNSSHTPSERGMVKSEREDAVCSSKTPTQTAKSAKKPAKKSVPHGELRRSNCTHKPTSRNTFTRTWIPTNVHTQMSPDVLMICLKNALIRPKRSDRATSGHFLSC